MEEDAPKPLRDTALKAMSLLETRDGVFGIEEKWMESLYLSVELIAPGCTGKTKWA